MPLIGSKSSFAREVAPRGFRCGECRRLIPKGAERLVSRRRGKVVKQVCSNACRETFDDRYWSERADDREDDDAGR